MKKLTIPELSLVLLIGPSGCGKSTFARKHFRPTEIVSSDFYRGIVCDDEANQEASSQAFELVHQVVAKRLEWKRFTVVDATNVQADARKVLLDLARKYHYLTSAIVFDLSEEVCHRHNRLRVERTVPGRVIAQQMLNLRKTVSALEREGINRVFTFHSVEEVESAVIERVPLWIDKRQETGPFDIIGDIHGCFDELLALLSVLGYHIGYQTDFGGTVHLVVQPPPGRKAIFVGDLGDRGPDTPSVYRLVMGLVRAGRALCVLGNHDYKLLRKLRGNDVKLTHGLADTMEQLGRERAELRHQMRDFLEDLVSHYMLDNEQLVVAHAGLSQELQGRASGKVRTFSMFGDITGETDEHGMPVRLDWAARYRGKALVVYGHTPVAEPRWLNNTVNIDTGCVFGGKLSALRYPEREVVSVPARRQYCEPGRPFLTDPGVPVGSADPADDLLYLEDVSGKRVISTGLLGTVTVAVGNCKAAEEVMSQFAANPRWVIYLPPTLSPCEMSGLPGVLEHPAQAFNYYQKQKIHQVICEEKHRGSRAVVILCQDEGAARRVFRVEGEGGGILYTRTGRRFFKSGPVEAELLGRVREAMAKSGLWQELQTDWVCIDAELISCSAQPFTATDQRNCWPVGSITDVKIAPFHLLASAGAVHAGRPHTWHLEQLGKLAAADSELIVATASVMVDVENPMSVKQGVAWWEELTAKGGAGMVVKPMEFISRGAKGLVQPGIKCRGREDLRRIYGPEYRAVENVDRHRALATKRGLALREFALGIEGLERFVRGEPFRRVHECCFAVLSLENEPVDPRL